ncbi:hypothetical protein FE257_005795 [Aspergillus nanangensis]|uniref:Uncharacterized protein n=1 Tax=Aspergillus nanangensis TaxID=2582783 RepID=A0AAD4CQ82_ASPNN|nr:hypothetical protein FE257_005795 [Aspergillus nanangensis]
MLLLELPSELIDEIWLHLCVQRDMNNFIRTCRSIYEIYNSSLYRHAVQDDCTAAAHWAGQHGQITTIKMLIAAGAKITSSTKLNPLIPAVEHGHETLVQFLLQQRGNDEAASSLIFKDNKKSALHIAAEHGHTGIASTLLAVGYPLHGTQEVWQCLPKSADYQTPFMDECWQTPLIAAAAGGHEDTILLLLDAGARTDLLDDGYCSAIWYAAEQNCSVPTIEKLLSKTAVDVLNHLDSNSTSPLGVAVQEGHLDIMNVFISTGQVDLYAGGRESTPLRLTIEYDQTDAARLLFDAGVSANGTPDQYPPLPMAAKLGQTEILRMLLDNGADATYVLPWGETSMGYAAWQGHYDAVRMLLDAGALAELEEDGTHTPLVSALWEGYDEIATLLAEHGARWDPAGDRVTPLQVAIRNGNQRVVEILLLDQGARFPYVDDSDEDEGEEEAEGEEDGEDDDDDESDYGYRPPLMVAAMNARADLMRFLLRQGGDPYEADWRGRTPLSVAAERGFFDVVIALLEDGTDMESWSARYHGLPENGGEGEICPSGRHIRAGRGRAIDTADHLGRTPLFYATVNGRVDIAAALVARGSMAMDQPTCASRTPRSIIQAWTSHPRLASRGTVHAMRGILADISNVNVHAGPVLPVAVYHPEKEADEKSKAEGMLFPPYTQGRSSLDLWCPSAPLCEHCDAQVNDYGHSFYCGECGKGWFAVCPECFARGKGCRVAGHLLRETEEHDENT